MDFDLFKWGNPEKSIKNAAQKHLPQVRRNLHSKIRAHYFFNKQNPLYFKLQKISNIISRFWTWLNYRMSSSLM